MQCLKRYWSIEYVLGRALGTNTLGMVKEAGLLREGSRTMLESKLKIRLMYRQFGLGGPSTLRQGGWAIVF